MIKTVIFDIGNVLLHFSHEKMILQLAEELELPYSMLYKKIIEERMIHDYEAGQMSTEELLNVFHELSKKSLTREILENSLSTIFRENEPISHVVKALKKQRKKLLLLSNTNEIHFHYINRHFPLIHLFDEAILSYEVKSAKPEPAIFMAAIEKAGCLPHEIFYIDDVQEHVDAAKKIGVDAVLFTNVETLKHDLAVRMVFV